jgi:hypothetical protein
MGWIVAIVLFVIVIGAVASGPIASRVEPRNYAVVVRDGGFEIRSYTPAVLATVAVDGGRRQAIQRGFRILARSIFEENASAKKIAMTAAVTQQGEGDNWQVHFVMPARETEARLPGPKDPAVKLEPVGTKRFAVVRFDGTATEASLARRTEELEALVKARGLAHFPPPIYAFYDPPWTLPFLRRNEVMVEIGP